MAVSHGPGPFPQTDATEDRRAALYVRMSTDHQRYSTANQAAALERYAKDNGLEIVKTYADEGKSGLQIAGREALQQLILDVQGGEAGFGVLLVFDVSRWGRFQDADESAYYEYLCRRSGVKVVYCAEPFENDGTPIATIVKSVKRAMAGEFSRELSAKVLAGQIRLIRLGYKQGGLGGYGYRRQLVDAAGRPKGILARGERKSLQDDRVMLVPGPPEEARVVRGIYQRFIEGDNFTAIARGLNARGVPGENGRSWSAGIVRRILCSEKYRGETVFGRTSAKLKQRRTPTRPEDWVRCAASHPAIVSKRTFARAQARLEAIAQPILDADILEGLKRLLAQDGELTMRAIQADAELPCPETVRVRFGSLTAAYGAVGFARKPGPRAGRRITRRQSKRTRAVAETLATLQVLGATVRDRLNGEFEVNDEFSFAISCVRPALSPTGDAYWRLRFRKHGQVDFRIVARIRSMGSAVEDYFIFPTREMGQDRFTLTDEPGPPYSAYRFADLKPLFDMAKRVRLPETLHG